MVSGESFDLDELKFLPFKKLYDTKDFSFIDFKYRIVIF